MLRIIEEAITFDDVLLLPDYSDILPCEVSLKTKLTQKINLKIPLVSAAMDTVTESHLAIAMAQEGGIGIIHKNMSIEAQASEVYKVKKFENGMVINPVTAHPKTTIHDLLAIIKKHNFSSIPVVDNNLLVGLVTSRDIRFAKDLSSPISNIMTRKEHLVTVREGTKEEEIRSLFHQHRIEKILVVNHQYKLIGLITVKDIQRSIDKPHACKDDLGRLMVGAAFSSSEKNMGERITSLIEAGVDVIVVDTAHGHSQRVIKCIRWIKKYYPKMQVIGGNVATAEGAKALIVAGVDGIKVGIGPGSICTTRVVTGVGVPQLTAIANIAEITRPLGIPIISDGGIRYSGDICKAIAAGASTVMLGGVLAGTKESPGEVELFQGRSYKSYRGMGSLSAMVKGSSERYFQDGVSTEKLVPEGIEGRVPYKGEISAVIYQLIGGLRAGMGYTGCATIQDMNTKPNFIRITGSGLNESHISGVMTTKEPPNYQLKSKNM